MAQISELQLALGQPVWCPVWEPQGAWVVRHIPADCLNAGFIQGASLAHGVDKLIHELLMGHF